MAPGSPSEHGRCFQEATRPGRLPGADLTGLSSTLSMAISMVNMRMNESELIKPASQQSECGKLTRN